MVSLSNGMALMRAYIRTLRPLIEEMDLSGLMTRNTLSPVRSIAAPSLLGPFDDYSIVSSDAFI